MWNISSRSTGIMDLTPSQTVSSFPVLCAKVEVKFFHGQQDLHSGHFWILVAFAPFRANVQYPNVCPWPCYPTRIGNRDILCSLFVAPFYLHPNRDILCSLFIAPLYLHPNFRCAHLIAFLEGVCYECTRQSSTTI